MLELKIIIKNDVRLVYLNFKYWLNDFGKKKAFKQRAPSGENDYLFSGSWGALVIIFRNLGSKLIDLGI